MRRLLINIITLLYSARLQFLFSKKIKKILRHIKKNNIQKKISKNYFKEYKRKWKGFGYLGIKRINWLKVYTTLSGVLSVDFIPEYIYYTEIEPRLNYKPVSKSYSDKNFYHKILDPVLLPHIYLRNIDGIYYDENYLYLNYNDRLSVINNIKDMKLVIKPSFDSGGGRNVHIIKLSENSFETKPTINDVENINELLQKYHSNFILQEHINQHGFFSKFNQTSLNTIRVLTYRSVSDETINVLHMILRMGFQGSIVDNQASGGLACGINEKGYLNSFAVDKMGNKYFEHNGIKFKDVGKVFMIEKIQKIAHEIANKFPYSRILGFDFCIDEDENVKLIEINNVNNEINFYQMNNGPLFKGFTNEVIELCKKRHRSFVIDFDY